MIGYQGFVPGVKSENVFGQSYGKTSNASVQGNIQRGFDAAPEDRYKSLNGQTYVDQQAL